MPMNAMEKLAAEISRVTELKAQYESLAGLPGVNVRPVLAMIGASLKRAIEANGSNDPGAVVTALRDLAGFAD